MSTTPAVTKKYHYTKDRASLLTRMKKIEGQARGIKQMITDDRYCIQIIQQLAALSGAADEVSLLILQGHIEGCITDAVRQQNGQDHIEELMRTIRKAMRHQ